MGDEGTTGGMRMRNQHQIWKLDRVLSRPEDRPTAVVADDGLNATVVILEVTQSRSPGTRFQHRGREWEIRGRRHGSRVLVAEPVEDLQQ
jgi:hypothetical protein